MPQDTESRSLDKVIVRLPDGMRDQLKLAAAENNRSMNAEIVARLEDSFTVRELFEGVKADALEQVADLGQTVAKMASAMERQSEREAEWQQTVAKLVAAVNEASERQGSLLDKAEAGLQLKSDVERLISFMDDREQYERTIDNANPSTELGRTLAEAIDDYAETGITAVVAWMSDNGFISPEAEDRFRNSEVAQHLKAS